MAQQLTNTFFFQFKRLIKQILHNWKFFNL